MFRCSECSGKVIQERVVEEEDGRAAWWYRCQRCRQFFAMPLYESQIDYYGTLDVFDPGLEKWDEEQQGAVA
jgi:hypothetical protein